MRGPTRLLLMLVLIVSSCSLGGGSSSSSLLIEEQRTFNAQTLSGSWEEVSAHLRYEGEHCLVYVDEEESASIPQDTVEEIGGAFDTRAYPVVTQYFGEPYDVDGNGKVILLLLDIQDGYSDGSSEYVAGYFDYSHLYATRTFRLSNEADMIFLDTYPGLRTAQGEIDTEAKEDLKLTMAHEFQHLVDYSEKVIRQKMSPMDTWINEGLSAAAEYLYLGKHVDWKIAYFNQVQYLGQSYDPGEDANLWGQYFVSWGAWGDPLVNYSTVYLFFQWLRIHAGPLPTGGPEVYKQILQEPYSDYRSVVNAFNTRTGGSWTWKKLFRTWLLANLLNQSSEWYGYKDQLTDAQGTPLHLYPRFFINLGTGTDQIYFRNSYPPFGMEGDTAGKAFLYPGDAVYVKLSTSLSLTEMDPIAYGGTTLGSGDPVVKSGSSTYDTGEILIAGNVAGEPDGGDPSATATLLVPGNSGSETMVGIIDPSSPQIAWIPAKSASSSLLTPKSSSLLPSRPHPIDVLLGNGGFPVEGLRER
ncbi:MAG: hypothetical protein Kow009_09020 [Spirochaetales bacterium]